MSGHIKDTPSLRDIIDELFGTQTPGSMDAIQKHVEKLSLTEQRKVSKTTLINLRLMFSLKMFALSELSAVKSMPSHPFGCLADLKSDIDAVVAHIQDLDARIAAEH